MDGSDNLPNERLNASVEKWLNALERSFLEQDFAGSAALFQSDGYWRDLLALSWKIQTIRGRNAIEAGFNAAPMTRQARNLRLAGDAEVGHLGQFGKTIDAVFTFETEVCFGRGVVHLMLQDGDKPGSFKALAALTSMQSLKAFPATIGKNRERSYMRTKQDISTNWLDRRIETAKFSDRDPAVVVIGAGQAGLVVATELGQLGVDTLVVDRQQRTGDSWRDRYYSLKLHNETCMSHLPYLSFPETWPAYLPKDKLANWLEFYADAMELNIWNSTTVADVSYDRFAKLWTVRLRLGDNSERTLHPSHVIMATGLHSLPNTLEIEGSQDFSGVIVHATGLRDDYNLEIEGKSALVVGSGVSAHDMAQDLYLKGADVTMMQRSATTVISVEPSSAMLSKIYREGEGVRPIADLDLLNSSVPYDLHLQLDPLLSKAMNEADSELLAGLKSVGFALDEGDGAGFFTKLLRRGGGYYVNVGASELIIEGEIKLRSGVGLAGLDGGEAIFTDGSRLAIDILVLAIGYKAAQETVRKMFGNDIADLVGPVGGISDDGELRNLFGTTRQPGFHIVGGSMIWARMYSRYTALLIKGKIEGLIAEGERVLNDTGEDRSLLDAASLQAV